MDVGLHWQAVRWLDMAFVGLTDILGASFIVTLYSNWSVPAEFADEPARLLLPAGLV